MKASTKALKVLKRNTYGTILLGLLLPVYANYSGQNVKAFSVVAAAVIIFTFLNLQYISRLEKALRKDSRID